MHRLRGWNTEGRLFDFYKPDYDIEIPPDSVVMTFAALEQVSGSFGAFIDFLLAKRPKLCVFVEPIYEWYDPANFIDHELLLLSSRSTLVTIFGGANDVNVVGAAIQRQTSQAVAVKPKAAGTSVVTSRVCASSVGHVTARARASNPAGGPKSSRAQA